MKSPVSSSVSVVLVIIFLIALPYLFFFFQPSVWFAISSRVSRNNPVDASQQSTASADPSSDVDPNSGVSASSNVSPSSEVPANSAVSPSSEALASSEVPANSAVTPSPEVPVNSAVDPSSGVSASSNVSPSSEVPANSAVAPSSEALASSEVPANSAVAPSSEAPASSEVEPGLESMLQRAATANKTVIITTLNQAWATPGTMIDVFLESFQRGEDTKHLLNHLVMVALDQRSFQRCRELHEHCFMLRTPGVDFSGSKGFMSHDFLKMMWRRMRLLRRVLELGYNFVFTVKIMPAAILVLPGRHVTVLMACLAAFNWLAPEMKLIMCDSLQPITPWPLCLWGQDADILWLRNPFNYFASNVDFQISCDKNRGNVWSTLNRPNCGYQYAQSNERTISMYQHWCRGGERNPNIDEQSLLNKMLHSHAFDSYKVKIQFLPTERFSGFCQKSKNMSRVVTMHANCCTGLNNKVQDLRTALSAWEARESLSPAPNTTKMDLWHVPDACRHSLWPSPPPRRTRNPPLQVGAAG